jgi:hypothetical protein
MTLRRQYTLPHCNLVLEGLSSTDSDPLAPLAVLMNAECRLPGATDATLAGGREFLDSLVAAVSRYGQHLLSGVPQPAPAGATPPLVEVKPGEGPYHHLVVQQQPLGEPVSDINAQPPLDIKLTTVQFYDLMEAVDQLLADSQTLPDLTAQFQSVSRRLVPSTEPMAKRAAPAVLGAAALAAAGLALFFVPPPEFEPTRPESAVSNPTDANGSGATEPPQAADADEAPGPDTGADPEAIAEESAAASDAPASDDFDRLTAAPAIADAATVALLREDLAQRLRDAWAADPRPSGDLAYRLAVAENGDILGYRYENDLALAEVDNTPLPELTFVPVEGTEPVRERVAQYLATFTADGEVRVEPVGAAAAPAAAPELPTLENKVTDGDRIRDLNGGLYDSILAGLEPLSASEALRFRVRLTETGEVVGYEPVNAAAGLLAAETPLPRLVEAPDSTLPQADFQVVFTEQGVLEVSPWDGWPE